MAFVSGPFNLEQGNSAKFGVEFLDITGSPTVPLSATMTVTYTTVSNSSQVDSFTLNQVGTFFTGSWASTNAALGLATYSVLISSVSMAIGQLRVLQRKAG